MNFADINGWVEVFKTGKHTDSAGNTKDWTEEDLIAIAENYDPAEHEAPVVIGHPADNAPAFAWVEGLKTEGKSLYAKFKDLIPEFVDMVKQGLFKKRSIALYPDLGLQHIGFLGAVAPAVKGLENIKFNEGGYTMEYVVNMEDARADPGEQLAKKTDAILNNQPKDEQGNPKISFSQAFSQAQRENPALTQLYAQSLTGRRP